MEGQSLPHLHLLHRAQAFVAKKELGLCLTMVLKIFGWLELFEFSYSRELKSKSSHEQYWYQDLNSDLKTFFEKQHTDSLSKVFAKGLVHWQAKMSLLHASTRDADANDANDANDSDDADDANDADDADDANDADDADDAYDADDADNANDADDADDACISNFVNVLLKAAYSENSRLYVHVFYGMASSHSRFSVYALSMCPLMQGPRCVKLKWPVLTHADTLLKQQLVHQAGIF